MLVVLADTVMLAFVLISAPSTVAPPRAAIAAGDAMFMDAQPRILLDAAAEVIAAAARFGDLQEQAARGYTHELLNDDDLPSSTLIDRETELFNSCLVLSHCGLSDDECVILDGGGGSSACDDLTRQMNALQRLVAERRTSEEKEADLPFGLSKLIGRFSGRDAEIAAAASEVKAQAARFGTEAHDAAADWVHRLAVHRELLGNKALLEQRIVLFRQCQLGDQVGSDACVQLNAALTKMADLRALLMAQAAADTHIAASLAANALAQHRQTSAYRYEIPERLRAWGCDESLWRKVKNRTQLRRLARVNDEKHGRRRIARLREKLFDA